MCYAYHPDHDLFRRLGGVWHLFSPVLGLCLALAMGLMVAPALAEGDTALAAPEVGRYSGLPLPRFVSIKSSKVNMRIGPGEDYGVKWVYQRRHLPVEIIGEYDLWRQVRDRDGEEGWIHIALLDGRRYGLVIDDGVVLTKKAGNTENKIVAEVEVGVVVRLLACSPGWCRVEAGGVKGWVERAHLWGLYDDEIFD
ncbi:MAG: hypothetical protein EP347_11060 [Alphaproteobacteria bacterium]|nr:MAG: hypothetical protein EP347_11060 [Alphaproteobacteria bacterium]